MTVSSQTRLDPELYPVGTQLESGGSAVAWPAVWAGAVTAMAVWLVLFTLGAGFGLAGTSSWQDMQPSATAFRVAIGLWLIVTQWLAFALGGYIAGRLRVRWVSLHTDEVFFRDTAHGLLAWAIATVVVAGLAVLVAALATPGPLPVVDMPNGVAGDLHKAAAASAIFTAIAMLIGGFTAAVSAVIGGRVRDLHP
jgi:hypothetical protein